MENSLVLSLKMRSQMESQNDKGLKKEEERKGEKKEK